MSLNAYVVKLIDARRKVGYKISNRIFNCDTIYGVLAYTGYCGKLYKLIVYRIQLGGECIYGYLTCHFTHRIKMTINYTSDMTCGAECWQLSVKK